MIRAVVVASATLVLGAAVHTAGAQTFKVAKYNIGGEGGTDYVTAEAGTGRVFVARDPRDGRRRPYRKGAR